MSFDIHKYEKLLSDVDHTLMCLDPLDPHLSPLEHARIRRSNTCLRWLYENKLKDRYPPSEVTTILGLCKHVLIPYLTTLEDPNSLSMIDMFSMVRRLLTPPK
jgi:hypothetical protein